MARFYGTLRGNRGGVTRLGHDSLNVTAQSYSGDILVSLRKVDDVDMVTIRVVTHGGGDNGHTLYSGPVSRLLDKNERGLQIAALVGEFLSGTEGATKP